MPVPHSFHLKKCAADAGSTGAVAAHFSSRRGSQTAACTKTTAQKQTHRMAPLFMRVVLAAAVAAAASAALVDKHVKEELGEGFDGAAVRRTQSCCIKSFNSGCNEPLCQTDICATLPSCCNTQWTDACAAAAIANTVSCACTATPKYLDVDRSPLSFSQIGPDLALVSVPNVAMGHVITSFPRPEGSPHGRLLHSANAYVEWVSISGNPPSYNTTPDWESDVEGIVSGSIDFHSGSTVNGYRGLVWYPPLKAFVGTAGWRAAAGGFFPTPGQAAKIVKLEPTGTPASSKMTVLVNSWVNATVRGLAYSPSFSPSVFGLDVTSMVNVVNGGGRDGLVPISPTEPRKLVAGTHLIRFNPLTGVNTSIPVYFVGTAANFGIVTPDNEKPVLARALTSDSCGNFYVWFEVTRAEGSLSVKYFGLGTIATDLTSNPNVAFVRKMENALIRQGPDFTAISVAMDGKLYGVVGDTSFTNVVTPKIMVANKEARQCFCAPNVARARPLKFWCEGDSTHVATCAACSAGCNTPANLFNGQTGNDIFDGTIWHHTLAGSSEVQVDLDPDNDGATVIVSGFTIRQSTDPKYQITGVVIKASNAPDGNSGFVTVRRFGTSMFGGVEPMPPAEEEMYFKLAEPTRYRHWSIVFLHNTNDLRLWGVTFDAVCPRERITVDQRREADEVS